MKFTYFILLVLVTAVSCKKSNSGNASFPVPFPLDSINTKYQFEGANGSPLQTYVYQMNYFTYKQGLISTRRGIIVPNIYSSQIYNYVPDSFDTLVYSGNTVTLVTKNKDDNPNGLAPNPRTVVMQNGRIQELITATDTTVFFYSGGRVIRTEKSNGSYRKYVRHLTYDEKGNLKQAFTGYDFLDDGTSDTLQTLTFSQFDNTDNPFKSFVYWDDLFYRSLSTNNFAVCVAVGPINPMTWSTTFQYDASGKIDYSK